jgi:hypothetical protein
MANRKFTCRYAWNPMSIYGVIWNARQEPAD